MSPSLREALEAQRRRPARFVFVDFDGTVAPIVDRPAEARVDPRVPPLLERLVARSTRVAVVTGRTLDDIRARLALPGLVYAAVHGLVVDDGAGPFVVPEAEAALPAIRAVAAELDGRLAGAPGVEIEDKGLTVAVHVRRADPATAERALGVARALAAARPGVRAVEGKKVVELRPDVDWDKGRAVVLLLHRLVGPDWRGRAGVVYLGDDRTDEDAFAALGGDGVTIRVGPADEPTRARFVVPDVDGVVEVLAALAGSGE